MKEMKVAYVLRSGVIQVGDTCPEAAIPVASGPEDVLTGVISTLAVHGWDKQLRAGGVASAATEERALEALQEFSADVRALLEQRMMEANHAQA